MIASRVFKSPKLYLPPTFYVFDVTVYIFLYCISIVTLFYLCVLVTQLCLALCDPTDYSLPGFSVRGTLQARILEWIAILFSRGTSQPRDRTLVSCITGRFFTFKFFCPFTFTLKWLTHHRITILVYSKFDCILYQSVVQFCIILCY